MKTTTPARQESERAVAGRIIARWISTGAFPDRELAAVEDSRAAVGEMVLGVTRWFRALDWLVRSRVALVPRTEIHALLLVGAYQLFFMDRSPDYATVSETVEAAKAVGGEGSVRLVNGVLRGLQRNRDFLRAALERQPPAVKDSHPEALIERWTARWGAETVRALCAWNNTPAETVLHALKRSGGADCLREKLAGQGVAAHPHPGRPADCLILSRGVAVAGLPGYAEGEFMVQDPSTLVAPDLLAPRPGATVLDACAAPGGKAVALAEALEGNGTLIALDLHADRLGRLRDNLDRTGHAEVRIVEGDAANPDSLRKALASTDAPTDFDSILADVPCTNTGVLRRRVDAKWRFTPERLGKMVTLQSAILSALSGLLRPGGALVYSTCSLEPEENEQQVRGWLKEHPGFRLEEDRFWMPGEKKTDGAYAARIMKEGVG